MPTTTTTRIRCTARIATARGIDRCARAAKFHLPGSHQATCTQHHRAWCDLPGVPEGFDAR